MLDRSTVVALAAGLAMLQVLIFSAGFLLGAAGGVQALTPPDPPSPAPEEGGEIRLASLALSGVEPGGGSLSRAAGEGRGGGLAQPQALTPPDPPLPLRPSPPPSRNAGSIRLASFVSFVATMGGGSLSRAAGEGRGGGLAEPRRVDAPTSRKARAPKARPSPLARAAFLLPEPAARTERKPAPARIPAPLPRTAEAYAAMIREAAERHSVSPALIEAVARVESGLNPRALSHKGARGLMQVIPATGRRFGVRSDKLFDPEHNIAAGTAYLAWLSRRYRGNLDFILAAYNAGEGAVDDHGGIPPYRETRNYVRRVKGALRSIEEKALAAEPPSGPMPPGAEGAPAPAAMSQEGF